MRAYHHALGSEVDAEMGRRRLRARVAPEAEFFAFTVPPGSVASGRPVREVAWPDGCTLVSVQRGRRLLVPSGDTVLEAGDVVTAPPSAPPGRRIGSTPGSTPIGSATMTSGRSRRMSMYRGQTALRSGPQVWTIAQNRQELS